MTLHDSTTLLASIRSTGLLLTPTPGSSDDLAAMHATRVENLAFLFLFPFSLRVHGIIWHGMLSWCIPCDLWVINAETKRLS